MSGAVAKLHPEPDEIERVKITPKMAMDLLEHNTLNRPLSDGHVKRLAQQIIDGKWKYNGDTIKVSKDGAILDGQHRLWAVIEAKRPIETVIIRGIARDAFATIDTTRRLRSGGDVLALNGVTTYRTQAATADPALRLRRSRTEAPIFESSHRSPPLG